MTGLVVVFVFEPGFFEPSVLEQAGVRRTEGGLRLGGAEKWPRPRPPAQPATPPEGAEASDTFPGA